MTRYRFTVANRDKPHRCPCCHATTWHATELQVIAGVARCPGCRLWWWRGWAMFWPWDRAARRCVQGGRHEYPHRDSLGNPGRVRV